MKVYKREDILQADCFQWSWNERPQTRRCIWHVPNGGDRRIVQAIQFQAMGVVPGVCDMHFFWQSRLYIIELKVMANLITEAQKQYIDCMTQQGAIFYECRSLEKWQEVIDRILQQSALPCEYWKLIKIGDGWKVAA